MYKIKIVCVGKVKESYFREGIDEYLKRLSRFAEVKVIELKEENITDNPSDAEIEIIKSKEGENILKNLSGKVVSMCIEGKKYSSESFSKLIGDVKNSTGELTFVIGGSYGIDNRVKEKSDIKLSFSDMTFPHTMFRLMLVEQIYRAFKILENSKYHK